MTDRRTNRRTDRPTGRQTNGPSDRRTTRLLELLRAAKNTPDTWHMTRDMWHGICDMWQMVGGEYSLKIAAPMVWDGCCLEDCEQKDHSMNYWIIELIMDKGVYRRAPATPDLLNISSLSQIKVQSTHFLEPPPPIVAITQLNFNFGRWKSVARQPLNHRWCSRKL